MDINVRDKRNKYILKSKNGKIKIYNLLATLLDKQLDFKYKYKIIKIPSNYNIKKQIENNPKFELLSNRKVKCATRNKICLSDYDEYVNRKSICIKKHKIIKKLINNSKTSTIAFFGINYASIFLPYFIKGYLNPLIFTTSICVTFPFYFYLSCEEQHIKNFIQSEEKYDVINKMEDIYQTLINNFCLLVYHLKITNPLDILFLYNDTISKLCMSELDMYIDDYIQTVEMIEKNIKKGFDGNTFKEIGYSILAGFGVCRNHTKLFNDICNRLGYNSKMCSVKSIEKNDVNHAIVKVKYNNSIYLLDPARINNYKIENGLLVSDDLNIKFNPKVNLKSKIDLRRIGFYTINKNYKNINYKVNIETLHESFLTEEILLKIDKFNEDNKKMIDEFKVLFYDLVILDNKEKIKLKDMVIK